MKEITILYYVIINLIAFILFWTDKIRSIKGRYRISEKVLLLWSLFGGALGGLASMYIFRHKTRKKQFSLTLPIMLISHICLIAYLYNKAMFG